MSPPPDTATQRFDLLNQVPVGVCIINKNYEVLFWNVQLEFWLNIPASHIEHRKITDFFPKFREIRYAMRIANVFSGGAPEIFSSHLHTSLFLSENTTDKHFVHHTIVTATPSHIPNENNAMITVEDVTELTKRHAEQRHLKEQALLEIDRRTMVEEQLRTFSQQLTEVNATKDKFFSIIAHDMREPLGAIINFTDLLLDADECFTKEERNTYITELGAGAKSLLSLLENLLTWARAQTDRISFKPRDFDLKKLADTCIALLSPRARQKNIAIQVHLPQPFQVHGDKNMLKTVLTNLLSNAIKFTPHNEIITITGEQTPATTDTPAKTRIHVTDSGIGLSEKQLKNLFRVDTTTSTKGTDGESGTGLGLILCHEFMKQHGGTIQAESTPGAGSTFTFEF